MVRSAKDVYRDALALNAEEREELVRLLTQRDDEGWASPEIKQAWIDEIRRRDQLDAEGKIRWIPGEEVFRDLHKLVDE
jgi:hypothetical protein